MTGRAPPAEGAEAPLLRERARALAQAREEERTHGARVVLPFEVGGRRFAAEARHVHQVLDAGALHPLLGAPRGVIGAIMCRTRPVGVLDPRPLLDLGDGNLSDLQRVVVLEDDGDLFGLAVERVLRRVEVPAADVRPAPPGPFLWLAPGHLAVLDPARIGATSGAEAGA